MTIRDVRDVSVDSKRVILRLDLNVPVKGGAILDDSRLRAVVPTLKDLTQRGARVVILSHFGRPQGVDEDLSLRFLTSPLSSLLNQPVHFCKSITGEEALGCVEALENGEVLLVENVRFDAGEEANDATFAKSLARLGDMYVNDAFSVSHRAHASVEGITHFLPSYAGSCLMQEVSALTKALLNPARPMLAIVAGSKISTKLTLLESLVSKVDMLILGGGIANTFLKAQGFPMGSSLVEDSMIETARRILEAAKTNACEIILPVDAVVAKDLSGQGLRTTTLGEIASHEKMFDVGPKSVAHFTSALSKARTLVWNGPLGVFETPPFHEGTFALAKEAARLTHQGSLYSIGGGGETVAALSQAGAANLFSYLSLAGGAFLEFLEGKQLPGLIPLTLSDEAASQARS